MMKKEKNISLSEKIMLALLGTVIVPPVVLLFLDIAVLIK